MDPLLHAVNVRRSYGKLHAVDGVDLTVSAGDRHALIGCNGAGKTTFLHLIAGTVRVSAGRIEFAGRAVTGVSPARRARRGIARTFQTPALLDSLTAAQNLYLGCKPSVGAGLGPKHRRRARRRAIDQLEALGLADRAETPAGELAHGQRRLLEIGAALAAQPRLLLLDEPAAGLTDEDLRLMLDCLKALPSELAMILVEHNQDVVAEIADTVTVLHEGSVLTSGTPAQVATHPQVVEVYLGAGAAERMADMAPGEKGESHGE